LNWQPNASACVFLLCLEHGNTVRIAVAALRILIMANPLPSKEVSLYDVLIEAESYFRQQAKTFAGYGVEAWWSSLATAAVKEAAKSLSAPETFDWRKYVVEQLGFLGGEDDNKPAEALIRAARAALKTEERQVIPGRLGHTDWCRSLNVVAARCDCGAAIPTELLPDPREGSKS
jgi:hypothetical protein